MILDSKLGDLLIPEDDGLVRVLLRGGRSGRPTPPRLRHLVHLPLFVRPSVGALRPVAVRSGRRALHWLRGAAVIHEAVIWHLFCPPTALAGFPRQVPRSNNDQRPQKGAPDVVSHPMSVGIQTIGCTKPKHNLPRLGMLDGGDFQGAVVTSVALILFARRGHRLHLDLGDMTRPAARPPAAVALNIFFVVWQRTSLLLSEA